MDLNGYYGGIPRLPLVPVGREAQAEIAAAFDGLKG
jgi:4-hydroxy-2-oxoglutarate aldolase